MILTYEICTYIHIYTHRVKANFDEIFYWPTQPMFSNLSTNTLAYNMRIEMEIKTKQNREEKK